MSEELKIELVREIAAPRERVFEAWLDGAMLARFLKPAPGVTVHDVSVDAREGGAFTLIMRAGDADVSIRGEYLRIERYERLDFSWLSSNTRDDSRVRLTFEELDPRRTRITLRHAGFPDEGSRAAHDGGWSHILATLAGELA